jgi:hypothetical protein
MRLLAKATVTGAISLPGLAELLLVEASPPQLAAGAGVAIVPLPTVPWVDPNPAGPDLDALRKRGSR